MNDSVIHDLIEHFKDRPFLSIEEVAGVLGVSPKVVYNWTRRAQADRRLPKMTMGRVIRLPRSGFIEWLQKEFKKS